MFAYVLMSDNVFIHDDRLMFDMVIVSFLADGSFEWPVEEISYG